MMRMDQLTSMFSTGKRNETGYTTVSAPQSLTCFLPLPPRMIECVIGLDPYYADVLLDQSGDET